MNEEIEYAEMLEIPVSTVNVVKKTAQKRKRKPASTIKEDVTRNAQKSDLKESVIAQINDKIYDMPRAERVTADAELFAESANSEGQLHFDGIPDRIDTVRLYSTQEDRKRWAEDNLYPDTYELSNHEETQTSGFDGGRGSRRARVALGVEFALACAFCGAIFLTNVFMPNSAVNTFFRAMTSTDTATTDSRAYTDFTLSSVVSDLSDAELSLSPTGVLSLTGECQVYPSANGTVSEITQTGDTYLLKISYSDSFSGIVNGLSGVYYQIGDKVKANVPVGYSNGESEVQVTMYSDGQLLNCFQLTEENCLAWVTQE